MIALVVHSRQFLNGEFLLAGGRCEGIGGIHVLYILVDATASVEDERKVNNAPGSVHAELEPTGQRLRAESPCLSVYMDQGLRSDIECEKVIR
jgi:hypothetical protein